MQVNYSNGTITAETLFQHLALNNMSQGVLFDIIKLKEAAKKAGELQISVSDEELQQFSDHFRALNGLNSKKETLVFLEKSGMSVDEFETFCEERILAHRLCEQMTTQEACEDYFMNQRGQFDRSRLSIISVTEESLANELAMQIQEDGEDFHALARTHSVDTASRYQGGYVGEVSRNFLNPEISTRIFNSRDGDLLGPFPVSNLFIIVLVEEVIKPELDDNIKKTIKKRLFNDWVGKIVNEGISMD